MRSLLLACFLLLSGVAFPQGLHSSQYYYIPVLVNPAGADHTKNMSFSLLYRSQWRNVAQPYTTYGVFVDKNLRRFNFNLVLTNNDAGAANFRELNFLGGFGFHTFLDANRKHLFRAGLQAGIIQKTLSMGNHSFDSQYDPVKGYDPNANSGEALANLNRLRPDVNAGIFWQYTDAKISPYLGLAIAHLNQPGDTYKNVSPTFGADKLLHKYMLQAGAHIAMSEKAALTPHVLLLNQGAAKEFMIGANLSYQLNPDVTLIPGAAYRVNDAVAVSLAARVKQFLIAANYDLNTSSLRKATNGRGAFELVVSYYLPRRENDQVKKLDSLKKVAEVLDTDKDGVTDDKDKCPKVPGLLVLEGCPPSQDSVDVVRDTDKDGLTDAYDQCPYEPGSIENRGCPVTRIDADGDGIPNKVDECVYTPGVPKFNGCPDSDGDGIEDKKDRCPFTPGVPQNNGCPIENKEADILTRIREGRVFNNVEFEVDKSYIRLPYQQILDELVDYMTAHPKVNVVLYGHTDSDGSASYNLWLSNARSKAVRDYLLRRGIDPGRISDYSFGESKPIKDNETTSGKARNRRVELILLND